MKITGQYLNDLGYRPVKWFSEAIETVNSNNGQKLRLVIIWSSFSLLIRFLFNHQ